MVLKAEDVQQLANKAKKVANKVADTIIPGKQILDEITETEKTIATEVAEKVKAAAPKSNYGSLSGLANLYADINQDGTVTAKELASYNKKQHRADAKLRKQKLRIEHQEKKYQIKLMLANIKAAKEQSFAKIIVAGVMGTYFVAVLIGGWTVIFNPEQLGSYLTFVGGLTSVAFAGYYARSGFEHVAQIRRGNKDPNLVAQEEIANVISTNGNVSAPTEPNDDPI
jgi:hypothetical protein